VRDPARILIVDDTPTNVDILAKRLSAHGYEILTAGDGEEGLAVAREQQPDLILLDIMMPVMDGIEALRALRSQESTKNIPVIMVTTKSEEARVATCYKLGCADYVTKPVDKTDLLTKVQKYLTAVSVPK